MHCVANTMQKRCTSRFENVNTGRCRSGGCDTSVIGAKTKSRQSKRPTVDASIGYSITYKYTKNWGIATHPPAATPALKDVLASIYSSTEFHRQFN